MKKRRDEEKELDYEDQAFYLYAVTVDSEKSNDAGLWDGSINILKKFTEAKINDA